MRKIILILAAGVLVVSLSAQDGPLRNAMNLAVRTDGNGYVIVAEQTYTGPDGPLRNFGNTLVRTDASGYLIVTNPSGLGPIDISGTPANDQIVVWVDADTVEGDANFTWDGQDFEVGGTTTACMNVDSGTFRVDCNDNTAVANGGGGLDIGLTGVNLMHDSDGALTFLGLGDGFDEDLTLNLDDIENTGTYTSSTGLVTLNFSSIALQESGIAVLNNDEIDSSSKLAAIVGDETGTGLLTFATAPTFTTSITVGGDMLMNSTPELFINETANAGMTIGLTVNMGANDNQAVAIKSSDVSHPFTALAEDDTFGSFRKGESTSGGYTLIGYKDSDGAAGFAIYLLGRLGEAADTNQTTAGLGVIHIQANVTDGGTSQQAVDAGGNAFVVANGATAEFIVDGAGNLYANAGTSTDAVTVFDAFDDASLVRAFDIARAEAGVGGLIRTQWDERVRHTEDDLVEMGVLGAPLNEGGLINFTRLAQLHNGAIFQNYVGRMELTEDVKRLQDDLRMVRAEIAAIKDSPRYVAAR